MLDPNLTINGKSVVVDENGNFARISYEFATFFCLYMFYGILLYRKNMQIMQ